jgi:hypothetical protein
MARAVTQKRAAAAQLLKVRYCSDKQVQHFCEVEALDFDPQTGKSARDLFAECRARYTDVRCLDLIVYVH